MLLYPLYFGCAAKNSAKHNNLFEILNEGENWGSIIKFYEIITENSELGMLSSEDNLKGKIKKSGIQTAKFIILKMSQKSTVWLFNYN